MKGLLIKDFCLLRNQSRTVPIFLVLALWFALMNKVAFCISFLGMMSVIVAMSSFSFDELDHCQTSLFTLPFSRKTYVAEKYILSLIVLAGGLLVAFLAGLGRRIAAHDTGMVEILQTMGFTFVVCMLFTALMVPIRIRFQGDQGRIILGIVMGGGMFAAFGISRIMPEETAELGTRLAGLSMPVIIGILAAVSILCLAVSYILSVYWIKKKEF